VRGRMHLDLNGSGLLNFLSLINDALKEPDGEQTLSTPPGRRPRCRPNH
jgi:hypothetical protein